MPKIYEYFGIVFYFYANEHLPIHVHARKGECETIFEIIYYDGQVSEIKIRKAKGKPHLQKNDIKEAEVFVKKYANKIVKKWNDFFIFKKEVSSEKIIKEIK